MVTLSYETEVDLVEEGNLLEERCLRFRCLFVLRFLPR